MSKSVVDQPDFTVAQRGYVAKYTTKPFGGGNVLGTLAVQAFIAIVSGILVAHATRPDVVPAVLLHVARFGVVLFTLATAIVLISTFCTVVKMTDLFPKEDEPAVPEGKLADVHIYLSKSILPTYAVRPILLRSIRPLCRVNRWVMVAAMICDGYTVSSVGLLTMSVIIWGAEITKRNDVVAVIRKLSDADILAVEAGAAERKVA